MSRQSSDQIKDGFVLNGYDYALQVWVLNGIVRRCGHPESMGDCCNGKKFAGLSIAEAIKAEKAGR